MSPANPEVFPVGRQPHLVEHLRVYEDLVVVFPHAQFAQDVELAQIRLKVHVPVGWTMSTSSSANGDGGTDTQAALAEITEDRTDDASDTDGGVTLQATHDGTPTASATAPAVIT